MTSSLSSSPEPCAYLSSPQVSQTTILPEISTKIALMDSNLPFLSPYPVPPPFTLKDFSNSLKVKPQSKPPIQAQILASTFVYGGSVYVEVKFSGARLAGQFELKNSCDSRAGLIGAFLATSLSPDGNIRLEVPRKATQEQLKQGLKTINQSRYNASVDLVSCLLLEINDQKSVAFEVGEGKRCRNDYKKLGVFYDHMKQFVSGQEEYQADESKQGCKYHFNRLKLQQIDLMNIGTFQNQNYLSYVDEIYKFIGQFSTSKNKITDKKQYNIQDIHGITYISAQEQLYSIKIQNSIKHRRLLICILILLLSININEFAEILVNSVVLPVEISCFHDYICDYKDYQDMDILLLIGVLQQQKNNNFVIKESKEIIKTANSAFLGDYTDHFHQQLLDMPEPLSETETTITAVTQQEFSDIQICPEIKLTKIKAPRLTKEYIRRKIELHNFSFFGVSQPNTREKHNNLVLQPTKLTPTHQAMVFIENQNVQIQFLYGRNPKFYLTIPNSSRFRRISLGIIAICISAPPDAVLDLIIQTSDFDQFSRFLFNKTPPNSHDLKNILQNYQFSLSQGGYLPTSSIFVNQYFDSE